jgi:hypothetical protein
MKIGFDQFSNFVTCVVNDVIDVWTLVSMNFVFPLKEK